MAHDRSSVVSPRRRGQSGIQAIPANSASVTIRTFARCNCRDTVTGLPGAGPKSRRGPANASACRAGARASLAVHSELDQKAMAMSLLTRWHQTEPRVPPDDWYMSADYRHKWRSLVTSASQACCCPARPAVVVLMPPALGRPHRTDLLLCRHHYRASRQALTAAGATVLDPDDVPTGRRWPGAGEVGDHEGDSSH